MRIFRVFTSRITPALLGGCLLVLPGRITSAFAQDISGFWLGVTYPSDPLARIFNYTANFTQTGTTIGGSVQTADTNVVFGGLAYANGQFLRGILTYREQNQTGNQDDTNTCYWDATLRYDPATESLKGSYVNILTPPFCTQAGGGTIELYRIRLKSGLVYCPDIPVALEVTGLGIRWYDSPGKTRLLATGNRYATRFSQSTTLYVTQTVYNTESPAVPIAIEVSAPTITDVRTRTESCGRGMLTATATGGDSLHYRLDGGSFQASPVFNGLATGSYTLTVRNSMGCTTSSVVAVEADCPERVYVPTAFSPNGDGLNETLTLYFPQNQLLVKHFRVFNRWGSVVFSRAAFTVRSGDLLWDALDLPPPHRNGTFAYTLDVEFDSNTRHTYRGVVMLLN